MRSLTAVFLVASALLLGSLAVAAPTAPTTTTGSLQQKARSDAAAQAYTAVEAKLKVGAGRADDVYVWSKRWYEAQRAEGVTSAATDHKTRMQALEATVKQQAKAGTATPAEVSAVAYFRADADLSP